ncbi:MAG: DUF1841 family protein [Betaproteobacteria bacterium]
MSGIFNPSRDQARDFLFEAWRKYRAQERLTAMESMGVGVIAAHGEYHEMLNDRARYLDNYRDRDYPPEFGETNPFLHLGMHIAIREQVSIDQPAGVRDFHESLSARFGSVLDAEHEMMDCLAEMIWQSQRNRTAPDAGLYVACLRRKLGK